MSKLQELINELCPDGVECKTLKEVACISIGEFVHKNLQSDLYSYPVYNGGVTNTGFYNKHNQEKNKIIISARGANAGFVNRLFENFWAGNSCYVISTDETILNWNYAYYYIKNIEEELKGTQQTGSIPSVSKKQIEEMPIDIPPLPVQEEIVRILDNMTDYVTELKAELKARKLQYEYYRDMLLEYENCEKKSLCHIAKIKNGSDYKAFSKGDIPVYGSGGIMTYVDRAVYDKPTVLIPRKGSVDKLYYVEKPFWNVDTIFYTEIDESQVIPKYLYYLLQKEHLENYNTAGGVPSLTQNVLNKIKLNIPSLDRQRHVVSILDRFDTLCNDISSGLPAEIEARQKQYEYYRDKLLSFKEINHDTI